MYRVKLMEDCDYYVYEHVRPDTGMPFYVGKGKNGRAFVFNARGKRYDAVVSCLTRCCLKVGVRIVAKDLTEKEAFLFEMDRIAFWRKLGVELVNITNGGDGTWGLKYTPERRAKLSRAFKGRVFSAETLARMSAAQKGHAVSAEHRLKLSVAGKHRRLTDSHKQKIRLALLGKPKSAEHRAKMLLSGAKGRFTKRSPEARARMSLAQKRRILSPETWTRIKAGISRAQKGRVASEESRRKMSISQTGRKHSVETRKKMRLAALVRARALTGRFQSALQQGV